MNYFSLKQEFFTEVKIVKNFNIIIIIIFRYLILAA